MYHVLEVEKLAGEYKSSKKYVGVRQVAGAATWSYRFKIKVNGETLEGGESGFATAKEASEARARAIEEVKETGYIKNNSKRFSEVYEEWIASQVGIKKPTTIKRHNSIYNNHLKQAFGDRYIISISGQELNDYLNNLAKPHIEKKHGKQIIYSAEYINGFYKTLSAIFSFAVRNGYIKENRVLLVEKINERGTARRQGVRIPDEIISQLEERLRSTNLHPGFYVGLLCGLRIGEIYGLFWEDVDFENRTMSVNKQLMYIDKCWTLGPLKTPEAERKVIFNEDMYVYLHILKAKQMKQREEAGERYRDYEKIRVVDIDGNESFMQGLPFINRKDNGELLTPDSGKIVGRIAREDLDFKFRWHDLRHTYATIAANELHVNPNFLKRQMGHTKIETTLKYYTQVSEAVEEESRQLIQGITVKPYVAQEYDYDFDDETQSGKKLENQQNYVFRNGKLITK